jgi:phosphohistidine phosphatase
MANFEKLKIDGLVFTSKYYKLEPFPFGWIFEEYRAGYLAKNVFVMKYLILLRHGEAGFSDGVDFQRQLTPRGKENLNRLGEILQSGAMALDFLHCSSATRTRETAEIIRKYVPIEEVEYSREIYEGNLETLMKLLEHTPKSANSCMLIGHNPTISLLLSHLTHEDYIGLQPGMMAIVELEISDWSMIGLGTGTLKELLE